MRINTRFTVAVHILSLIALSDTPVSSEMMALSIGNHPVAIRQVMSSLKQAGLIETQNGIAGGRLTKPPSEITLCEIYQAVKSAEKPMLFDVHPNPNPLCPVGCNIKAALEIPLLSAQQAMEDALRAQTLQDITASIIEMHTGAHQLHGGHMYEGI